MTVNKIQTVFELFKLIKAELIMYLNGLNRDSFPCHIKIVLILSHYLEGTVQQQDAEMNCLTCV